MSFRGICIAAAGLLSCRTPTQITIEVTTDVPCADAPNTSISVGTLAGDLEGKPPVVETAKCAANGRVGSLVVVPSGGRDTEVAIRVVTGVGKQLEACRRDGFKGCIVARRAIHFRAHDDVSLPIAMNRDCLDIPCDADKTCSRGKCVSAKNLDAATPANDAGTDTPISVGPGSWKPMASSAAAGIGPRSHPGVAWTGSKMVVWSGEVDIGYASDGGIYDPATDTWKQIPEAPMGGGNTPFLIYTGSEVIAWKVYERTEAAAFDLTKRVWRRLPEPPPSVEFPATNNPSVVWATTTNEMLVWGGAGATGETNHGIAYSPASNTYRKIAISPLEPRQVASAVWDGTRMIVFGGNLVGALANDAAAYDPKLDTWSAILKSPLSGRSADVPLATGPSPGSVTFFGGGVPFGELRGDGVFLKGNEFTPIPEVDVLAQPRRSGKAVWFAAGRLYMWGGYTDTSAITVFGDGAAYDPKTFMWSTMPVSPLGPRAGATAVWTGSAVIVWGGDDGKKPYDTGALFVP